MIRTVSAFLLAVAAFAAAASACLWDSDTLRYEAKGIPGLVGIITGRLDRPPPLYYQMRLDRVSALLEKDPSDLAAYDDAAVACDRLGRGDEAVEWMRRKEDQMDRLPGGAASEHRYRYHANLGTFLAHRWVRAGARRDAMDDLRAGRDHIAEAIRINPDAHFGREEYQLLAMDFVIAAPEPDLRPMATLLDLLPEAERPVRGAAPGSQRAAIDGLAGLIALGNAWESLDVFYALVLALDAQGDSYLAELAGLRCAEIAAAGGGSLDPQNKPDDGQGLHEYVREAVYYSRSGQLLEPHRVEAFYRRAREEAQAWRAERDAFMLVRLKEGRHPDTDPSFWSGYVERPAPTPPGTSYRLSLGQRAALRMGTVAAPVIAAVLVAWLGVRRLRRRRRPAPASVPA